MKPLVIIPCLNEEKNISELVPEILKLGKLHILLVIDKSTDNTAKAADKLAKKHQEVFTLHRKGKKGLGKSYIDGFKWALKRDYDVIIEMDGDFSHDPKYLPEFLKKIKKYDLVIGSRYYNKRLSVVNWDLKRVFLSILGSFYARIVTRVPVSDATTGFKCFKRKVLENIDLDKILSEGYSFQIEMNWRTHRKGFRIGEIPIIFYERKHGKSKLSTNIIREALWILWKMKFHE